MKLYLYGAFLFFISLIFFSFGEVVRISGNMIEFFGKGYVFNPFFSIGLILFFLSLVLLALNESLETIVIPTGPSYEADRQRTEAGIRKYKENENNSQMLISGKYNDGMCFINSQPIKIYKILRKAGIPRDRIILENKSNSTQENVLYVCEKIREKGIDHLLIATDEPHAKRFRMLFEKAKKRGYAPRDLRIRTYSEGIEPSYGKGKALIAYLKDYFTFR